MTKLESVCLIIAKSSKEPISTLRLSLMVYLCDWKSSLFFKRKITEKEYRYQHHSIKDDIMDYIGHSIYFKFQHENIGAFKDKILLIPKNKNLETNLTEKEIAIINDIIKDFSELYFNDLLYYVSKTAPLTENEIYATLDLEKTAINFQLKDST